jgi:hypothetical protein
VPAPAVPQALIRASARPRHAMGSDGGCGRIMNFLVGANVLVAYFGKARIQLIAVVLAAPTADPADRVRTTTIAHRAERGEQHGAHA